ncbi:ABC transporter ATP-binding protein [Conexivisphaera calida]|uniref:Lipoprotein releasing system ATP-binding protein LolD n=1 Tax=Conexivisphaera calida TaxID=1874277 RepID=A0A4P2VFB2_9ARCH|nr:ABC transporter ATP-binding protein [Conexivisphaera calida]BBE42851.1 Lipoprotein releasing system ATP-binding protein LolD [Conexivisphaera calida]
MQPAADYAIYLDSVRKVYGGAVPTVALDDVTLGVRRGEFISIVGPSGSGKSTLLNIMGALDRPTSGRVYIAGRDVSRLPDDELSRVRNRYIGFVFQAFNLITRMSVVENVELPLVARGMRTSERRRRAMEALKLLGVDHLWAKSPRFLSGGEQQRVAIARALAQDPEFVLADEPTGNLDSKNSDVVMRALMDVNRRTGKTVIMVTHNMELAAMTDKIYRIRDGRIEGVETPQREVASA